MKRLLALSLLMTGMIGCTAAENGPGSGDESNLTSIPEGFGKSDNYISTRAQEYILSGSAAAALPTGYAELAEEEKQEAVDDAIASRTKDLTRAARRAVDNMIDEANRDIEDEELQFFMYVKSSFRNGTTQNVEIDGDLALFDFEMELVASNELIEIISSESGEARFDIEVDTATDDGQEILSIDLRPSPSTDAFPKYNELFEDGIYDISIHFGGDYNEERYDIETAKWTVQYLIDSGWQNDSVTSFEELRHDSPPFTMALTVEGNEVEARVYVYHAQMDDDADLDQSLLRDLVETSMKERDVLIYSGHAGSGAGMILDYHPRYELDDKDFDEVEMPEKYQIFVFDGCETYRTYVDALMENPAKSFDNTDAVTTVNTTPFSAGYEIINRFVHWLTLTDDTGNHFPMSWNTILHGVNDQYPDVHYGVHGIDQDPKLNPHAGRGFMCSACETDADCGAGGNYCLNYEGGGACGVACTTAEACGEGYDCIAITEDPDLFYVPKQCVRSSLACGA